MRAAGVLTARTKSLPPSPFNATCSTASASSLADPSERAVTGSLIATTAIPSSIGLPLKRAESACSPPSKAIVPTPVTPTPVASESAPPSPLTAIRPSTSSSDSSIAARGR